MSTTTKPSAAALAAAAAMALPVAQPAASAAEYQLVLSGWPTQNISSHAVSPGTSLAVGALSGDSASGALEARKRTSCDSDGTALRSDKWSGFIIIVR